MADTDMWEAERERFEAEIRKVNDDPKMIERWPGGAYKHLGVDGRWGGWKMACRASRPAEVDERTPRPIATAPHDGTEVLAWSITGKTWHQVYWKTQEHGNWLWEKPFPPRWACRWNRDYYQGQNEFSYWLPIPGAPSHTTNKEKGGADGHVLDR